VDHMAELQSGPAGHKLAFIARPSSTVSPDDVRVPRWGARPSQGAGDFDPVGLLMVRPFTNLLIRDVILLFPQFRAPQ
jgi:hypothetical protein